MGWESPSPTRSPLACLSCYPCAGKKLNLSKNVLSCFGQEGGEDRCLELPLPRSSQTLSELLGSNCSAGRVTPEPELTACSFQQSREYCTTSYSPDRVLVRCLCSVSSQLPFYLSTICFNCFKVKTRPSVCSCCCGEGGVCYSTP